MVSYPCPEASRNHTDTKAFIEHELPMLHSSLEISFHGGHEKNLGNVVLGQVSNHPALTLAWENNLGTIWLMFKGSIWNNLRRANSPSGFPYAKSILFLPPKETSQTLLKLFLLWTFNTLAGQPFQSHWKITRHPIHIPLILGSSSQHKPIPLSCFSIDSSLQPWTF